MTTPTSSGSARTPARHPVAAVFATGGRAAGAPIPTTPAAPSVPAHAGSP